MKFSKYIPVLLFFFAAILLSGCAATRISSTPVGPPNLQDTSKYAYVKVFYGTDRGYEKKIEKKKGKIIYTASRTSEIKYGTCEVYIPKEMPKEYVYPTFWRLDFLEEPTHLMVLSKIDQVDKKTFYDELSSEVLKTPEKKAFLFIHGFNMSFDNAAKRTAQIAYHLGSDVVPIFYSWPSMGNIVGYLADEDSVEWTRPQLKAFLDDVATYSGAKTIYLMAHSMGNRALSKAVMSSNNSNDKKILSTSYSSIMMAAPDIDQDVFKRDIAPVLKLTGASITIYTSANDNALKASSGLHNDKRVGEIIGSPILIDGIETVDVSGIDSSFTGHGYYFNSDPFLNDLAQIIKGGKGASLRPNLQPVTSGGIERYWKLLNVK